MTNAAVDESSMRVRGSRDERFGKVVSDKGDKTITVRCEFKMRHPKYGKYLTRSSNLRVHDERNEAKAGDLVEVVSCRPMSRTKFWRLKRIVTAGPAI